MKKLIPVLLLLVLLLSLAGCNTAAKTISGALEESVASIQEAIESAEIEITDAQTNQEDAQPNQEEEEPVIEPQDGEPIVAGPASVMAGSYTLETEWLAFKEPLVVDDIFDAIVAAADDFIYVLTDGTLKQYQLTDNSLSFEQEFSLKSNDYEVLCADNDGVLYLSAFMRDFVGIKDGQQIFAHDGPSRVAMHPSGKWGISWFTNPDVKKVTLNDGTIQTEELTFSEIDMVSHMNIGQNHIFVTGSSAKNNEHGIFIYDLNGKLQLVLGDKEFGEPDSLGSVTTVVETKNGFMGLDGNMRTIGLWKKDGTFIAGVDDGDLFGTRYPWLSTAFLMPDDSILVGMTEKRPDESAYEFILFRLNGF